jgi:paraquat-inducible protein B
MKRPKIKTTQSVHAVANTRLIGAFMLGAIALIIVVFVVFGAGNYFKERSKYVIYFRGSVDGLNTGAPVKIRGVQIGSVTDINPMMHENGDFLIEVIIETIGGTVRQAMSQGVSEKKTGGIEDMVRRGLRAQLQSQSFIVPQKMIVVDYFPETPIIYAGYNKEYKEIPSIPTRSEELEKSLENVLKEVGKVPFADISQSALSTFNGIDTFFRTTKLQPVFDNLSKNADAIGVLAARVDSIGMTISTGVNLTTSAATSSLKRFDLLVKRLEDISTENQYLLKESLEQLSSAARSMKGLADYLQQHPSDLLYGK